MRFTTPLFFTCVSSLALISGCKATQDTAPDPASVDFAHQLSDLPLDPAITFGRLDNGMRYALRTNATPSDTASLLFRFDTGSLDEAEDERGIAHFLEHMAFNGSTAYPEAELVKSLERLGLAFGADTNAYTSFDETVYQLELPNLSEEVVDTSLRVMRETADQLLLEPDAIDRERGVILSELRTRKSPGATAGEESLKFYLDGTAFPDRLPIGTEETINSVTAENFRAFYNGRYRPETTTLVMVGDFDIPEMETRIRDIFSDWTGQGEPLPTERPDTLPVRDPRVGLHTDPEIPTSIAITLYGPADERTDSVETRRERLIDGVGYSLLNRRFSRIATEGSADFLGASVSSSDIFDIGSLRTLSASALPDTWDAAMADAVDELRRARQYCFSESELAEWKANTRRGLERAIETADTRRTPGLARQLMSAITNERVITTPESSVARYSEYEDSITLDEVCERFTADWEDLESADLYMNSNAAPEGGEAAIREAFNAALERPITAPEDRDAGEFAYTDWGTPGEIISRTTVEDVDFTTVDFANGVRLNIKQTDYARDQIIARVSIGGGLNNASDWPEGFSQFAGAVLSEGGLEAHTPDELRTLLAGRNVSAGLSVGTEMISVAGGSSNRDLDLLFDLMAANVTAKGYREEAVTNFRRDLDAFYDTLDSTAGGVSARDVPRLLRSGDRRFGIPGKDLLQTLTKEQVQDIVEPLISTGLIEIGVVGDVEVDKVIEQAARTFGAFAPRPTELTDYPDAKRQLTFPAPGKVTLTHAGDADTALYQIFFPAFDGSDTTRTRHAGLARAVAQLKLTDVLREREGQSYSPSVSGYFPSGYDDYGYLGISVSAAPDALDTIDTLVAEVAAEMRAGEITEDEFDRAIRPIRESVERSLEENSYWLGVIDRVRTYPDELDDHRSRVAAYQNMTREDIIPVAKQIFDPDAAFRVNIIAAE